MTSILLAAIVSTLTFEGELPDDADYAVLDVEVPAGIVEIEVVHATIGDGNIIDWGLWGPQGFRGWSGGLLEPFVVGVEAASRGYLPGAIDAGTWQVVMGRAKVGDPPARYQVTVHLRDAATLAPDDRAAFEPVVLETGARWYAGDFHVHSRESGDATATFDEIRQLGRAERGLDFVALSDHNTISQHALIAAWQRALAEDGVRDLLLLRAIEVTTYAGHGNALGVSEYIDHRIGHAGHTAAAMIADIKAAGALFSVNHPALDLGQACIGCAWRHDDTPWELVDAIEIHTGPYDLVGTFTQLAMTMWDDLLDQGYRLTALGGSDDHRAGLGLGATQSPIGSPTTMVWAEELSEAALLEGVRRGRVVVKLRGPDDPMLELEVDGPDGERGRLGDTVTGHRVTVRARATGARGLTVMLVRNGVPGEVAPVDDDDFEVSWTFETASEGDRYRVHLIDGALDVVVTNHVHVTWAPGAGGGCGCRAGGGAEAALLLALAALGLRRRRQQIDPRRAQ